MRSCKNPSARPSRAADRIHILCSERSVVHEEEINVAGIVDEESLVARGHEMSCLPVRAVTDLGHGSLALEPPSHAVVNAFRLPPTRGHTFESIALMPQERLRL